MLLVVNKKDVVKAVKTIKSLGSAEQIFLVSKNGFLSFISVSPSSYVKINVPSIIDEIDAEKEFAVVLPFETVQKLTYIPNEVMKIFLDKKYISIRTKGSHNKIYLADMEINKEFYDPPQTEKDDIKNSFELSNKDVYAFKEITSNIQDLKSLTSFYNEEKTVNVFTRNNKLYLGIFLPQVISLISFTKNEFNKEIDVMLDIDSLKTVMQFLNEKTKINITDNSFVLSNSQITVHLPTYDIDFSAGKEYIFNKIREIESVEKYVLFKEGNTVINSLRSLSVVSEDFNIFSLHRRDIDSIVAILETTQGKSRSAIRASNSLSKKDNIKISLEVFKTLMNISTSVSKEVKMLIDNNLYILQSKNENKEIISLGVRVND